jgi:gluconate 5-dehydrogenase
MQSLQELFGLRGKVALVTGASSGLGVEFAKALATAGADVAILARRQDRLKAVAQEIAALGVRCLPVVADVTDEAQLDRALVEIEKALGAVDILVNNAGIAPAARAEKHGRKEWDQALSVNLTAVFLLSQRVARAMIARGTGGRIVNISSVMGELGNPVFPTASYNATKGAVTTLTKHLAVEWAPHKITVNAIAPGWFPSEMTIDPKVGDVAPRFKEKMESRTPLGRLGAPGELAGAVIYLASPAASYVTGAVLAVDGGWSAW